MMRVTTATAIALVGFMGGCAQQDLAAYAPPLVSAPPTATRPSYPTPTPRPTAQGRTEVALVQSGGTFQVPVTINGALRLAFVIDSGASAVSIPADVVLTLLRTGTLRDADFLGRQTYVTATGATFSSRTFRIRSLKVGDRLLEDVTGSIAPAAGDLLLGQSFLRRFQSWSIDNGRGVSVLD
jgi:clan AA aspartic protease (TIGR02281 family)